MLFRSRTRDRQHWEREEGRQGCGQQKFRTVLIHHRFSRLKGWRLRAPLPICGPSRGAGVPKRIRPRLLRRSHEGASGSIGSSNSIQLGRPYRSVVALVPSSQSQKGSQGPIAEPPSFPRHRSCATQSSSRKPPLQHQRSSKRTRRSRACHQGKNQKYRLNKSHTAAQSWTNHHGQKVPEIASE